MGSVSATQLTAQIEADTTLLLDSLEGLLASAQVRAPLLPVLYGLRALALTHPATNHRQTSPCATPRSASNCVCTWPVWCDAPVRC